MITTTTEEGFREHGFTDSPVTTTTGCQQITSPVLDSSPGWLASIPGDVIAKIATLPRGIIRRLLSEPTPHQSQTELFRDACWLHRAEVDHPGRETFLKMKFAEYYREITPREFERALERSTGDLSTGPRHPPKNAQTLATVLAENDGDVETLKSSSPVANPGEIESGRIIDVLFPKPGLLCFAANLPSARTQPRSEFAGQEHQHQFMVPNQMRALHGLTQDQRVSCRTISNVGPWVYQVIEFDTGTLDEQARIHLHLKSLGVPLVMVVFSGGKSLHGWYRINRIGGENITKFLDYASALGADRATFVACQLVRTPNAIRDGGAKQEVLYLDVEAAQ